MGTKTLISAEQYLRLPDLGPTELVRGEVISEGDRWSDITMKVGEYLHGGVQEVWIVDPITEAVQAYRADQHLARFDRGSELVSDALPGFHCRVADFFSHN